MIEAFSCASIGAIGAAFADNAKTIAPARPKATMRDTSFLKELLARATNDHQRKQIPTIRNPAGPSRRSNSRRSVPPPREEKSPAVASGGSNGGTRRTPGKFRPADRAVR